MTQTELYELLLSELDRSLVVDESTRAYWLKNYNTLPPEAVRVFCEELKNANRHIDGLVAVGIDENPEMGELIRQKMKNAKKKLNIFKENESKEEENPEELLSHLS